MRREASWSDIVFIFLMKLERCTSGRSFNAINDGVALRLEIATGCGSECEVILNEQNGGACRHATAPQRHAYKAIRIERRHTSNQPFVIGVKSARVSPLIDIGRSVRYARPLEKDVSFRAGLELGGFRLQLIGENLEPIAEGKVLLETSPFKHGALRLFGKRPSRSGGQRRE